MSMEHDEETLGFAWSYPDLPDDEQAKKDGLLGRTRHVTAPERLHEDGLGLIVDRRGTQVIGQIDGLAGRAGGHDHQ